MTVIFDGRAQAELDLAKLKVRVAALKRPVRICSFYFGHDQASKLYTDKKRQAAQRVGIEFIAVERRLEEPISEIQAAIKKVILNNSATGIMVQKPTKKSYNDYFLSIKEKPSTSYNMWWQEIVAMIPPERDVDGLSPCTQEKMKRGEKVVIWPATVQAVLKCLAGVELAGQRVLIVGKSDLLGWPLYWWGCRHDWLVELVGKSELERMLERTEQLQAYSVIVSATGQENLIKGEMIAPGVVLVDVGEPRGDVEMESCLGKAAMITPVPGGVGPLTVVSLLENSLICSEFDGEF